MREQLRTLAIFIMVVSSLGPSAAEQDTTTRPDDAPIYDVVIEHTLRGYFEKSAADSRSNMGDLVRLVDRTVAACGPAINRELGCFHLPDIERAARLGVSIDRVPFARLLTPETRAELTSNLASRNGDGRPLPEPRSPRVSLLMFGQLRQLQARLAAGEPASYAAFSLPGYSSDGHAILYATFICGNLCAYGWVFLLERAEPGWRIRGRHLLWIS